MKVAKLSVRPKYFKWNYLDDKYALEWIKNQLFVHDSDIRGQEISYWVVVDNDKINYYRCFHSWNTETTPVFKIVNKFKFEDISVDELESTKYAMMNLKFVK